MKLLAIFFIGTAFAETEDIDKVSEPAYPVCKDICLSTDHGGPGCVEGEENGVEQVLVQCYEGCVAQCEDMYKIIEANQVCPHDEKWWKKLPDSIRDGSCDEICDELWDDLLMDEFEIANCRTYCEKHLAPVESCPDPEDLVCPTCICDCQECDECEVCERCPVVDCPKPDCPPAECDCTDKANEPKEDKKTKDKKPGKGKGKGKKKGANGKNNGKEKDKEEKDEKKKDKPKGGKVKKGNNGKQKNQKPKGKKNKKNKG